MSNMTFPCVNAIQLGPSPFSSSPQCKKSSLRHHFRQDSWKLGSQKLLAPAHFWCASKFSCFPVSCGPRSIFGPNWPTMAHLLHPKYDWRRPQMSQKCTVENCGTTYLDPTKNNCSLFSSTFHVDRTVSRYGRLKLKFLCERFSHCIYSFCTIELTKTRNTCSALR